MVAIKIRKLIDLAIGFPETGQVNFAALHCLLICMADKMGITDEALTYDKLQHEQYSVLTKQSRRLIAGLNPDNNNENEAIPNELDKISLTPSIGSEEQVEANERRSEVIEEDAAEEATEGTLEVTEVPEVEQHSISETDNSASYSKLLLEKSTEHMSELQAIDESMTNRHNLLSAISILKHQLECAVAQLLLLTNLTLNKKPGCEQIRQLYSMAQTLNEFKQQNIPIKEIKSMPLPFTLSLNWNPSDLKLDEEEFLTQANHNESAFVPHESPRSSQDTLVSHLCYSPAKLLDQLMQLKIEFCLLTNKVNDLSSRLLQQEGHHLLSLVQETHKQMRDLKLANTDLKENHSRLDLRITTNRNNVENLKRSLEEILQTMVDKTYLDLQLANKVDYSQLQRKASLDQILELQCRIDKTFAEICTRFSESDKKFSNVVENLKITLGPTAVHEVLAKFKENISHDMQQLNELLRNYIESTNDDCAAAGARVKVSQDLACLSCDTNCVMPVREKAKVAKLPSAYASSTISSLVTYELSSIRKSGLMGYYRKDEFPHAPNAWLAQQSQAVRSPKRSPTRNAGGQHTTSNARERHQKIMLNRK